MNRKQKKELQRKQSTRQLMGINQLTDHGVQTPNGELAFFLLRPDNLSVLPNEGIRGRVQSLMELLRGEPRLKLMTVDSRESFTNNKNFYQARMEEERVPAILELLQKDRNHLDEIQTLTASSREFIVALTLNSKAGENTHTQLSRAEKSIRDRGFHVRLAGEQDVKRILAVYYQQDVTTEYFEAIDGERAVMDHVG